MTAKKITRTLTEEQREAKRVHVASLREKKRLMREAAARGEIILPSGVDAYVAPDEGVRQSLADMQHVYRNPSSWHDKTGVHKQLRLFFERDPSRFILQMEAAEDRHRRELLEKAPRGDESTVEDPSTAECLRVIREIRDRRKAL